LRSTRRRYRNATRRAEAEPAPVITRGDVARVLVSAFAVVAGGVILTRGALLAAPPAVLVGCAFIAFGVYRLTLAWRGYRRYRKVGQRQ